MIRLLKIEWLKNLSYRPFKIFTALYFCLMTLLLFIGLVDFEIFGNKVNLKEQGFYNFPEIWNFTTYTLGFFKVFLGCIIVFSICQEFSNRMFKQNIIDGLSKKEFLLSKILTILVFSGVSTLILFVATFLLGKNYSESQENIFTEVFFVGHYFVELFLFFCFLMFLSFLFRKSVFVFLGYFVWLIVENVLHAVEQFSKFDEANPKSIIDKTFISDYLPLNSFSQLIPAPFRRTNFAKMFGAEYQFEYPLDSLFAALFWIAVFIFGSYYILKKRDW